MAFKIEQEPMGVDILTQQLRIHGTIHVRKGIRLTDFVTAHKDFLPVTQAQIATLSDGRFLYEVPFMSLNWEHVVAILPTDAAQATLEEGEGPTTDEDLPEERMP
jgi:hypothetical protein